MTIMEPIDELKYWNERVQHHADMLGLHQLRILESPVPLTTEELMVLRDDIGYLRSTALFLNSAVLIVQSETKTKKQFKFWRKK